MIDNPRKVAHFVGVYAATITNALHVHADHMAEAAEAARSEYERGQRDPAVKAEQDATMVVNNGYKVTAEMFEQEAGRARKVATELQELIDGDED
ncbi:MAG TPA: hypothetical protein VK453_12110 [Micromonosporaceae bacterium]|nr:hypothetical protein [Micromonosporaceae bacterium]